MVISLVSLKKFETILTNKFKTKLYQKQDKTNSFQSHLIQPKKLYEFIFFNYKREKPLIKHN